MLIKKTISRTFAACGVHSYRERALLSDKAFVLMYHRVLPSLDGEPFVQPGMYVTARSFEEHVRFLKDNFQVVFLEELVRKVLYGQRLGRFCAITFDDGWRDNYLGAFPVLEKHGVPATIFLASGYVGTDRAFWPEELCHYLKGTQGPEGGPPSFLRYIATIGPLRRRGARYFFDGAIETLKKYHRAEREEILEYLRACSGREAVPRQMLDWDEVRRMMASGVVRVGAHTVNHELLDQVKPGDAAREIAGSRAGIERQVDGPVTLFAYPNGNHNDDVRGLVAQSGFKAAVTTRKGFVANDTPLMEIPRIAIHEDVSSTTPLLRSRIVLPNF